MLSTDCNRTRNSLLVKFLMHNCAHAKHAKHVNVVYIRLYRFSREKIKAYDALFNSNILAYIIHLMSSNQRNDSVKMVWANLRAGCFAFLHRKEDPIYSSNVCFF